MTTVGPPSALTGFEFASRFLTKFSAGDLINLYHGQEGEFLEFKSGFWTLDRRAPVDQMPWLVVRAILSLMNTRGGVVLLGVGNNGHAVNDLLRNRKGPVNLDTYCRDMNERLRGRRPWKTGKGLWRVEVPDTAIELHPGKHEGRDVLAMLCQYQPDPIPAFNTKGRPRFYFRGASKVGAEVFAKDDPTTVTSDRRGASVDLWRLWLERFEHQDPLAKYEPRGILGKGATGRVIRATSKITNSDCAYKLFADGVDKARFDREVGALRALDHPRVVKILDHGTDRAGPPFIAMEIVEGESLAEKIRDVGALEPEKAVEYTMQILEGVEALHAAGIVHRDLKPANVMVDRFGGFVRIIDLGAAFRPDATRLTQDFSRYLGTTGYHAPEQLIGRPTERTDIFQVGKILISLLTGDDPPNQNPEIPQALRAVCAEATDLDPNHRFASARSMRDALEAASRDLAGEAGQKLVQVPTQDSDFDIRLGAKLAAAVESRSPPDVLLRVANSIIDIAGGPNSLTSAHFERGRLHAEQARGLVAEGRTTDAIAMFKQSIEDLALGNAADADVVLDYVGVLASSSSVADARAALLANYPSLDSIPERSLKRAIGVYKQLSDWASALTAIERIIPGEDGKSLPSLLEDRAVALEKVAPKRRLMIAEAWYDFADALLAAGDAPPDQLAAAYGRALPVLRVRARKALERLCDSDRYRVAAAQTLARTLDAPTTTIDARQTLAVAKRVLHVGLEDAADRHRTVEAAATASLMLGLPGDAFAYYAGLIAESPLSERHILTLVRYAKDANQGHEVCDLMMRFATEASEAESRTSLLSAAVNALGYATDTDRIALQCLAIVRDAGSLAGRIVELWTTLARCIEFPRDGDALAEVIGHARAESRDGTAREWADTLAKLEPLRLEAVDTMADILVKTGSQRVAASLIALRGLDDRADVRTCARLVEAARNERSSGRLGEAQALADVALSMNPFSVPAALELHELLTAQGRESSADKYLEDALERQPSNSELAAALVERLFAKGSARAATALMRQCIERYVIHPSVFGLEQRVFAPETPPSVVASLAPLYLKHAWRPEAGRAKRQADGIARLLDAVAAIDDAAALEAVDEAIAAVPATALYEEKKRIQASIRRSNRPSTTGSLRAVAKSASDSVGSISSAFLAPVSMLASTFPILAVLVWTAPLLAVLMFGVALTRAPQAPVAGDPSHRVSQIVTIGNDRIDRTEVTVAAYRNCVSAGICSATDEAPGCNYGHPDRLTHPMNCVEPRQAAAYCSYVHGRLLSESTWNHLAANAPNGARYPWGSREPQTDSLCWRGTETCSVESNGSDVLPCGVAGLAGNVAEILTSNCSTATACEFFVARGGAFDSKEPADVSLSRSSELLRADESRVDLGFRCAHPK